MNVFDSGRVIMLIMQTSSLIVGDFYFDQSKYARKYVVDSSLELEVESSEAVADARMILDLLDRPMILAGPRT
jgi:hypothetical protein